jgi:hypothetical protein
MLGNTIGLPVTGPLRGLHWLARQIAEAAILETADPARIEADILALERRLDAGAIDEATFEAEEATLLARLETLRRSPEQGVT